MSLNETDISNGVSVSGSTNPFNTYIKTENAGIYNIQFSAQLDKTDSGADEIVIWLRKNGIDLTDTATTVTLSGNNAKNVAAWNWFVNSATNDYYQIIWQSADTNVRLFAEPMDGHPGIPSVIVTANRVDQFLSNTGSFTGSFTGQFTGSLFGTASFATSASFAGTSSFAVSSSFATSASFTTTSSFATSASFATTATTASSVAGYYRYIFTSQSVGSNASGETQLISVTIPANSFAASDKFYFRLGFSKVGIANANTLRVKLTTSASMPSGATSQIAQAAMGNTALYGPVERNMAINGGNLKGYPFTNANVSDSGTNTNSWSNVAFDVTQTQYFYVSVIPAATTADVTYLEYLEITNI
jgi:hypothetical protein